MLAKLLGALVALVVVSAAAWLEQDWLAEQFYVWRNVSALTASQEQALKPGDPIHECTDCPEMIVVPAGSFEMGSLATDKDAYPNEFLHHQVIIDKLFAVSKYELTFADWDACVAGGGCNGYRPSDRGWGHGQRPVISWDEAQRYVTWLSRITGKKYRLLSEAEYEYAARGGKETVYPWDNNIELNGTAMANCDGCGSQWADKQTAPAGSFAANAFGLYDMVGNVWEWTEDCYHGNYTGDAPTDGSAWVVGDCAYRAIRGGAWYYGPRDLRSARRIRQATTARNDTLGFRVARTLLVGSDAIPVAPGVR